MRNKTKQMFVGRDGLAYATLKEVVAADIALLLNREMNEPCITPIVGHMIVAERDMVIQHLKRLPAQPVETSDG